MFFTNVLSEYLCGASIFRVLSVPFSLLDSVFLIVCHPIVLLLLIEERALGIFCSDFPAVEYLNFIFLIYIY